MSNVKVKRGDDTGTPNDSAWRDIEHDEERENNKAL